MTTLTVAGRPCASAPPANRRAPNQTAQRITGRDYVSHSQLSLMRSCPQKFFYTYVESTPPDHLPVSLIYGGSVHAALQAYYRGRLEGVSLSGDEMLHVYHLAWQENREKTGSDVPVKFGAKETESSVHDLARRTFDAFLASPLANPKGTVLGVEEELRVDLHPDLPSVLTRVDLVTMDHAVFVTDFKTSRSFWTPQKVEESSDQLQLYAATTAGMARHVGLPVKLAFAILTKAKSPKVQVLPVRSDAGRIGSMTTTALTTWSAIVAGNFYPAPSPMNCSTCQFRSRCPVFARR